MPPAASPAAATPNLVLLFGDDDFAVKHRAREQFQKWCAEVGGMDHETIDASVGNAGEASKALARLREAMQTLPFFGGGKVVWFKDCNFLGTDRTSESRDVTEGVAQLIDELKTFDWSNVRLLLSAGSVDKRRTFYKTLDKIGHVEVFAGLSLEDKDWADKAANLAFRQLRALKKEIADDALAAFVESVGPNTRHLASEVEKLSLYVGERAEITLLDVTTIVTRSKHARAFALGEALGDRKLALALRVLDEELWEMKTDRSKSCIGFLYGLISKIRSLILAKELLAAGILRPAQNFSAFSSQLQRLPADIFGGENRPAVLDVKPFPLFRGTQQAGNYTADELVRAMDLLLECNLKLVSTSVAEDLLLQQLITRIISHGNSPAPAAAARRPANAPANANAGAPRRW